MIGLLLGFGCLIQSCEKKDDPTIPTVEMKDVINIKENSAAVVYHRKSKGGAEIIDEGICYGNNPIPTINDSIMIFDYYSHDGFDDVNDEYFITILNELEDGVKYYVRAFAKNEVGLAYSEQKEFTTIASKLPKLSAELLSFDSRTATCKVNVTYDGGFDITERGVVLHNHYHADTDNYTFKEIAGEGKGEFTITFSDLRWEKSYHLKAYATNENGTTYSDEIIFETPTIYGSFTDDRDGNVYRTLKIGSQTWMVDNLKYLPKVYPPEDGNPLQAYTYVIDYKGIDVEAAKEDWYYKNGAVLYNLVAAQLSCPEGWHLPTDEEWIEMELALGMDKSEAKLSSRKTLDAAKMVSGVMWYGYQPEGANESGLSIVDYGRRSINESGVGYFSRIWGSSYWTNTQKESGDYVTRYFNVFLDGDRGAVKASRSYSRKDNGLFVRCVKDE